MTLNQEQHPFCFGDLTVVFPLGKNGLRETPAPCLRCRHKTACLRFAMGGLEGLKVRQELVDRAYSSGRIGFWERWSRKKIIAGVKKDRIAPKGTRK